MKRVYFIRHGESEGNAGPIRRGVDAPLTEKGKAQVSSLVERVTALPIEAIISSTAIRAKETAEIIQKTLNKDIIFSDLFTERRRPSEVLGQPKDSSVARHAGAEIREKFHIPGYRFSDEENFEDLKDRARKALTSLSEQPETSLICITHGFFMRILMAYVIFNDSLTGEMCEYVIRALDMENTGITVLDFNEEDSSWKIRVWNDHTHLSNHDG